MYRRALGEHSRDSSLSVRDRVPCILRNIQYIKKETRSNANEWNCIQTKIWSTVTVIYNSEKLLKWTLA